MSSIGAVPLGRPSFANLVTDEERLELDKWLRRCRGPWQRDLQQYPPDYVEEMSLSDLVLENNEINSNLTVESLSGYYGPAALLIGGLTLYRNQYLAWCGSVQIKEGHPFYGLRVSEVSRMLEKQISVEDGGATSTGGKSIVHGGLSDGVSNGRTDVFGFDCQHRGDVAPYSYFMRQMEDRRRGGGALNPTGGPDNDSAFVNPSPSSGASLALPKAGGSSLMPPGMSPAFPGISIGVTPPSGSGNPYQSVSDSAPTANIPQTKCPSHVQTVPTKSPVSSRSNSNRSEDPEDDEEELPILTNGLYRDYRFARTELRKLAEMLARAR